METTPNTAMNTTSNSTAVELEIDGTSTLIAISVTTAMTLAMFPSFILNPLMLFTLRRVTSIQPTTKIYMAFLTLSDLCSSLCNLLGLVQSFAGTWFFGDFLCTAYRVTAYTLTELSSVSLVLLTLDRYIAISHPLRYPSMMTEFRSKILVCSTWTVTIITYILIFGVYERATVQWYGSSQLCVSEMNDWRAYFVLADILLPLVSIFIMYAHISLIARNQGRRIAAEAGNGQGGQRMNTRSTTTIIIITGTLIFTWIPAVITFSVGAQNALNRYDYYLISEFTYALFLSNSWLNVVIYYLRNRDLRQALYDLISEWRHALIQRFWP